MGDSEDKVSIMNNLLQKVVEILDKNNIPYYLDCGTLLGCVRENKIMEHDSDVDVSVHLSSWVKLNDINFSNYGLMRTRTRSCPYQGYIISVVLTETPGWYCDIYANPAFPQLEIKEMNGKNYFIPKNSDLYLTQLYGNWRVPSDTHADWPYFFYYNGLITGPYSEYWDLNFQVIQL